MSCAYNTTTLTPSLPSLFHSRWLVCAPTHYGIHYEINPWMDVKKSADLSRAHLQWQHLHHTLLRLGAWLEYLSPAPGLPDMVFTANGGLVVGNKVVLPRFRPHERQGEVEHFRRWFEAREFSTLTPSEHYFEGEGDALLVDQTLVGGYGMRSDREVYEEVATFCGITDLLLVKLVDPRFYHLDTCFCPLDKHSILIYPPAISGDDIKALEQKFNLIAIPETDAILFACNSVVLGQDVIMPAGAVRAAQLLTQRGFTVWPVELSEFIKAGGAAKCLSLKVA